MQDLFHQASEDCGCDNSQALPSFFRMFSINQAVPASLKQSSPPVWLLNAQGPATVPRAVGVGAQGQELGIEDLPLGFGFQSFQASYRRP